MFFLLFSVLCLAIFWYQWKFARAYKHFPSKRLEVTSLQRFILEKLHKNVPLRTFALQILIETVNAFQAEGLCVLWFLRPYVFIYGEEFTKILVNEVALADRASAFDLNELLIGNGLIGSKHEVWRAHRKLLQPAFSVSILKNKMQTFNEHANRLVQKLEATVDKPTDDVWDVLKHCTFQIMAEGVLGLQLKDERHRISCEKHMKIMDFGSEQFMDRVFRPWLYWDFLLPLFPSGRKYLEAVNESTSCMREIMKELLKSAVTPDKEQQDAEKGVNKSPGSILIRHYLQDPNFTEKDVRDHLVSLIVGGFEAVALSMLWCFYLLGHHPEEQEKAYNEVESTVSEGKVTYDDISRMKYLDCFIKESLRLHPPGPIIARKASKNIQCGQYIIPKGAEVIFFVLMAHRNPNIYPEPMKFDPERFCDSSKIRPWGHIPFAEGYRGCIVALQILIEIVNTFQAEGMCVIWFLRPYVFIYGEEFTKRLVNEVALADKASAYDLNELLIGNGLFRSKHETWRAHRKLLQPAFNVSALKDKMRTFNEHANQLVEKLGTAADKPIDDMWGVLNRCTFKIMAEGVLGLQLSNKRHETLSENCLKVIDFGSQQYMAKLLRPWLYWNFLLPFFHSGRKYLEAVNLTTGHMREVMKELLKGVIISDKEQQDAEVEANKSPGSILIRHYLQDPNFTEKDVCDHLVSLVVGGYETVAVTMLWCFYMLGHHPREQEKAYDEVSSIVTKGTVTYDDISKMKYLDCFIKETLRIHPAGPIYARKASKNIQCGQYTIPKGAEVVFFMSMVHRNPNNYPDPEKFDPERFCDSFQTRPWVHIPFAEGYRGCIGKKFAMLEMKVLLVHVLLQFKITTLNKIDDTDLAWDIITKPRTPPRFLFEFRQPQP